MSKPLSLSKITAHLKESWQNLPDFRKPNNNMRYRIADAALSAVSVFFMQSPSFLAHQREMRQRKRNDNGRTLFGIEHIPSDNQLRNLLDPVKPDHFHPDYEWVMDELEEAGHLAPFRCYQKLFEKVKYVRDGVA